jgi:hypothetical protein
MTFTDDDLKRLKEFKDKHQYFNFPTAWDANEQYDLINALLARLEAAEKVLIHVEKYFNPSDYGNRLLNKWRKAAGK